MIGNFSITWIIAKNKVANFHSQWKIKCKFIWNLLVLGCYINWTAACYVLGANWANQLPQEEDHMPFDGNPHPMPGQLVHNDVDFVLPPYPMLGWNDVPPPAAEHPQPQPEPEQPQDPN